MSPNRARALLAVWCAAVLAGCPAVTETTISIDSATPRSSVEPPSFKLDVNGHGFGLRNVTVDLSSGSASAPKGALRVELYDRAGATPSEVQGTTAVILSSTRVEVEVTISQRLTPGVYGVRIFEDGASEPTAKRDSAFMVEGAAPPSDGGPNADAQEGFADADPNADAFFLDASALDVDPLADAIESPDAGSLDASAPGDADPPDDGIPLDSGLGPFPMGYRYRRPIWLDNPSAAPSPATITMRVPVPHAQLVAAGLSNADGSDLAVFLDGTRLQHQWDDRLAVGTDQLAMIVPVPVALPPGPSTTLVLALYYGNAAATLQVTDAVFVFSEHFNAALPVQAGNNGAWNANTWAPNCPDRSGVAQASYCVGDIGGNPTRVTLGSPRLGGMVNTVAANETYEVSFWLGGAMIDQADDMLYFAYSNANNNVAGSLTLPLATYVEYPPAATVSFAETNPPGGTRTETGWRFPATRQPFIRARVRFVPTQVNQPSLHFRYISANNVASVGTLVEVDDLSVRRVLQPDLGVTLGPQELGP